MFHHFYENKTVLVTGVAGVKGSWLALALLEAGARVVGVDLNLPAAESNFHASGLRHRIEFIQADINDLERMRGLVARTDAVFHLAAKALVQDAREHPLETYRSNTLGVATVLETIRLAGKPYDAVFVTTDKVYRPKDSAWVETDPLGATGPYAVSKACAEFVIADYQHTFFPPDGPVRIGIARAGNVVIGGDLHSSRRTSGAGRIFVDCFEALIENRAPEIYRPSFTRPYTYGLDILSGYMTLMSRLDRAGVSGEAFNFGPCETQGVANATLASRICEFWGSGLEWRAGAAREEPFEFQALSCEKSRTLLDWYPAYTLENALQAATRWYRAWGEQGCMPAEGSLYDLNRALLTEYITAARLQGLDWALDTPRAAVG